MGQEEFGRAEAVRVSGRFVKGVSGNPGGKIMLPAELLSLCRNNAQKAIVVACEILEDEKQRGSDRLRAAELILDRGYGKPVQQTELAVWKMSPAARQERLQELLDERGVVLSLPPVKGKLEPLDVRGSDGPWDK